MLVRLLKLVSSTLQENTVMAVKSSESENKVFAMNVERSLKSGRDQKKDHESGRDEVIWVVCGYLSEFYPFFLTILKMQTQINLSGKCSLWNRGQF